MEDRQNKVGQENEALIQEMLRDAQKMEVPSDLKTHPVVHKGDETLAAPMTVKEISGAGYVKVYDTRTGEEIPVLYYMLSQKLRQRRQDGSFQFTTNKVASTKPQGAVKCMLHPEALNRAHYDELGFRVCSKGNITNQYQLRQHMIKKHPQEWAAIEQERLETERAEDRALQKLLLAQQLNRLETGNTASDKKTTFVCPECKADFGSQKTLDKHIVEVHK